MKGVRTFTAADHKIPVYPAEAAPDDVPPLRLPRVLHHALRQPKVEQMDLLQPKRPAATR